MSDEILSILLLTGGASLLAGAFLSWIYHRFQVGSFEAIKKEILEKANKESEALKVQGQLNHKQKEIELQREAERYWQNERRKFQIEEERIKQREDKLENRLNLVEKKLSDIEKREAILAARKEELKRDRETVEKNQILLKESLERVSGLTLVEAKEALINQLTHEVKSDAANLTRRLIQEAKENAEGEAARIISIACGRIASSTVSDCTVSTVAIPNDDMKGRIIGREGRNIRALEQATGVNVVIDDTPGAVVLTGFDPIRRHVAKTAILDLISDGRIHPTRIDEAVEKAKSKVQKEIRKLGEDAALRVGAINLHPEILDLLGKLAFRYSYGQNVLEHSVEVAHLMGIMAGELGLDSQLAKRIGLLHDMGKAVTHEIEGTHAVIGHDLALKYGETKSVANGIGCHHYEMEALTVEGSLCSSADAISASRPGARIEAVEQYVKRVKKLEEIAHEFPGVEKAYALQAGREVRVVVLPDMIDDDGLINLARDLKKRVEGTMEYPGKIKVTVIREKRAVEYAV
jgi:ribonuclease Y